MQEHTTAELGRLHGDVGELRGELNNQITRISDVDVEDLSLIHISRFVYLPRLNRHCALAPDWIRAAELQYLAASGTE